MRDYYQSLAAAPDQLAKGAIIGSYKYKGNPTRVSDINNLQLQILRKIKQLGRM
jgi:hypothetical protein